MTETNILVQLKRWQEAMAESEHRISELSALAGSTPDAPLPTAVYGLMGTYTHTVADMIGWDEATLTAWWLDHNFGERPMKIGFAGEALLSIDSIEALAAFIAEDLRRAAA
jgi:hypothetical protein